MYTQVYRILGQMVMFFPTDYNVDFYISFDVMMLIDLFTVSLQFSIMYCTCTQTNMHLVHVHFSQISYCPYCDRRIVVI